MTEYEQSLGDIAGLTYHEDVRGECGEGQRVRGERDQHPWLIFLLLLTVYLLFYSGQFHGADEESMLSMAESLSKVGWLDTPQRAFAMQVGLPITQEEVGSDGHLYSKKGWGWPAFLTPFYAISLLSSRLGGLQTAHLATLVVTALTGSLVYLCGRELRFSPRVSLWGALAFGLGSIAFVYSKFLFSEPFVGLTLTGSLWALMHHRRCGLRPSGRWRWAALGGLLFGLASAARLATAFLTPVLVVYVLWPLLGAAGSSLPPGADRVPVRHEGTRGKGSRYVAEAERSDDGMRTRVGRWGWHSAIAFGVGASIPLLLSGVYNWLRFGTLWQSGYASEIGFTTPLWQGLYGLVLSPGKGFFWFSPILLLAIPGSVWLWRRNRAEVLLIWGLAAAMALSYATWYMWWGGSAWGPRFLVPLAAPFTLLLLPVLQKGQQERHWAILLGLFFVLSILVQLLGSAVNFLDYGAQLVALDPRAEWTVAIHDVRYQPIWGHLKLLQPEHLDLSWVQHTDDRTTVDGWTLSATIGAIIACAVVLFSWERRQRFRGALPLLTVVCIGVILLGQVRLHDAMAAAHGARQWQRLYEQAAASARPQDILYVQGGSAAETGFWLDHSRSRRYVWSPRPIPLDRQSEEWIARYAGDRVWLASELPARVDPNRGIERWLLEHGSKLHDEEFEGGARLVLVERTPPSLIDKAADLTFVGDSEEKQRADLIRLVRYAYSEKPVTPGETVHLVLTWQAAARPEFDYSVFVHLLDANGRICQQVDGSPVGGLRPMSSWAMGEVVVDRYGFLLPNDCPPGEYRLVVGVYRWDTLERLPIVDTQGNLLGDSFEAGRIQVEPAHR